MYMHLYVYQLSVHPFAGPLEPAPTSMVDPAEPMAAEVEAERVAAEEAAWAAAAMAAIKPAAATSTGESRALPEAAPEPEMESPQNALNRSHSNSADLMSPLSAGSGLVTPGGGAVTFATFSEADDGTQAYTPTGDQVRGRGQATRSSVYFDCSDTL